MADPQLPDNAPATALFPQFESELYNMIAAEVGNLSDQHLDFTSDRWEWGKWSIRRNLSHIASGDFRWLLVRWGSGLFPQGLPGGKDIDSLIAPVKEAQLDDTLYRNVEDILGKLKEGIELVHWMLTKETVGSIRNKEIDLPNTGNWPRFAQAHPRGIRQDPSDPAMSYMSLEATIRHRYYEHTTHLYNMQRLKRAQGLTTVVEVPFEGYWAMADWDRSEP